MASRYTRSMPAGRATRRGSGRGRQRSTGSSPWTRSSTRRRRLRPLVRRGECNTCFNAVDRHVAGGRADQLAFIHDSAYSGKVTKFTYAELKREVVALASVLEEPGRAQGRSRYHLHADGARGGVRDARLRPARRRAFGGVRRLCGARTRYPHRRRQAEADRLRLLRARARTRRRLQAAARQGDRDGRDTSRSDA